MLIPDRYLIAGLDALCRAFPEPAWGWHQMNDAHRGAQLLSAWFMFQDGTMADAAAEPLLDLFERECALRAALFAPHPRASASASDQSHLIDQLATTVRSPRHVGHNAIFPALALKAFQVDPGLATPERIAGLARLAKAYHDEPPPADRLAAESHERGAWSTQVLEALFPAMAAHGMGIYGHLLTFGRAVDDLDSLGHHHLARLAKTGWQEYAQQAARPGEFQAFPPQATAPADAHLPNGRRYWQSRPVSFLEGGHNIKFAYAFFGHLARCEDPALASRGWSVAREFSDPNPHPLSEWCGSWEISGILPGDAIADMGRPSPAACGPLEARDFHDFVNCHDRWEGRSGHAAFFGALACAEDMQLELRIGYDGPIRVWLDDREVLTDLHGTNPALRDAQRRAVAVARGEHRLTVLMGLNGGKAYGFFLRWARLGLGEAELDLARFPMPRVGLRAPAVG